MEVQNLAGLGIDQARQGTAQKPAFDASNVNDQLGATLNQGGLLMRMAQSKGQGLAASRGLGNSTIGIDAAQRAMVDAALPIAQQNAQQANTRYLQDDAQSFTEGQSALDRQQQLTVLDKEQAFQGGQSALDRQQQLNMQQSEFANQTNQANLSAKLTQERDKLLHQQELGTLDKQGQLQLQQIEAELKSQTTLINQQNAFNSAEAAKDRQQAITMLEKQFGQETATLAQQVAANTHGMYLSAIDTAMGSYNERYAALMADNTMTSDAKSTMLNNMKNELNSTLNMYQKLYSNINTIRPDWTKFPTVSLPGVSVA
ncbi:hypothetical protein ACK3ZM_14530 [Aeromonas caviae]